MLMSRTRQIITALSLIAFAFGLALVAPRLAFAHAQYASSIPAANEVVPNAPTTITITFTEALEPSATGVTLQAADGSEIAGVTSSVDPTDNHRLLITPPELQPGTYIVNWHNLSADDGHPASGFFAFSVGAAEQITGQVDAGSNGPPGWWIAFGKWLVYLGLAVIVTTPLFPVIIRDRWPDQLDRTERRKIIAGGAVFLLGSLIALINQGAIAFPRDPLLDATWNNLTDTRYGNLWLWRTGLAVAWGIAIGIAFRGRNRIASLAAVVLAFAIPLTISETSHASAAASGRVASIAGDWLHLTSAMLWIGGLIWLIVTLRHPDDSIRPTIRRFSGMAVGLWIVLALTGVWSAWTLVGSRAALTSTSYGDTLIAKVLLLIPALGLAAANLLWFGPRVTADSERSLRGSILLEAVFALSALAALARLVGLQPAGDVHAAARQTALVQTVEVGGHGGTLTLDPGNAGPNTYLLVVPDAPTDANVEGLLRLTPPGDSKANKELKLARQQDGSFTGSGSEFALAGDWGVQVIVRQIGSFQWDGEVSVAIEANTGPPQFESSAWRFGPIGAIGMLLLGIGIIATSALIGRRANRTLVLAGAAPILLGLVLLTTNRI